MSLNVGCALVQPSVKQTFYGEKNRVELQLSYAPRFRTDCYVSVFLGTMPKDTPDPGAFARQRLIDLGWTPPADD